MWRVMVTDLAQTSPRGFATDPDHTTLAFPCRKKGNHSRPSTGVYGRVNLKSTHWVSSCLLHHNSPDTNHRTVRTKSALSADSEDVELLSLLLREVVFETARPGRAVFLQCCCGGESCYLSDIKCNALHRKFVFDKEPIKKTGLDKSGLQTSSGALNLLSGLSKIRCFF